MKRGRAFVGISGWRYPSWRGVFYPPGLTQKNELAYAASLMTSIEVNGSFYSLIQRTTYEAWYDATPDDFVLALKGSRYITHMLRLANAESALANFFASGVLRLGHKLGPILWQLPERVTFDAERLAAFFALLPRDHRAASKLARRHDARLDGRPATSARVDGRIRHALEVRSASFMVPELALLARAHDVALVWADAAGRFPSTDAETSDFVYVRLHGAEELYVSGYTPEELADWARRLRGAMRRGRDVYVYFDNDARAHAPFDALALKQLLEGNRGAARVRPTVDAIDDEQARTVWPAWSAARRPRAVRQ